MASCDVCNTNHAYPVTRSFATRSVIFKPGIRGLQISYGRQSVQCATKEDLRLRFLEWNDKIYYGEVKYHTTDMVREEVIAAHV